jgi:hypothetical protein
VVWGFEVSPWSPSENQDRGRLSVSGRFPILQSADHGWTALGLAGTVTPYHRGSRTVGLATEQPLHEEQFDFGTLGRKKKKFDYIISTIVHHLHTISEYSSPFASVRLSSFSQRFSRLRSLWLRCQPIRRPRCVFAGRSTHEISRPARMASADCSIPYSGKALNSIMS